MGIGLRKLMMLAAAVALLASYPERGLADDSLVTPPMPEIDASGLPIINTDYDKYSACKYYWYYYNKVYLHILDQRSLILKDHLYDGSYMYRSFTKTADILFVASSSDLSVLSFNISGDIASGYLDSVADFIREINFKNTNLSRYDFWCDWNFVSVYTDGVRINYINSISYYMD